MNQRLQYLDVAKGFLMIGVIVHHVAWAPMFSQTENAFFSWVLSFRYSYMIYFMSFFFIASGACSSFKRPFRDFFCHNFARLMVPHIVINLVAFVIYGYTFRQIVHEAIHTWYGIWFLESLFIAKMLYWAICRLPFWWRGMPCFALAALGIWLVPSQAWLHNYQNYLQALVLLPFLWIGQVIIQDQYSKTQHRFFGWVLLFWTLIQCYYKEHTDSVTNYPDVSWTGYPLMILMSIFAFCGLSFVGSQILKIWPDFLGKWLASIGRKTLVIYMFHIYFLILCCDLMRDILPTLSLPMSVLTFAGLFCLGLGGALVMDRILEHPYLSWALGKWEIKKKTE